MHCRILYLVGQLGAGGAERQLCYLLEAMDRKRYRPVVAVWSFSEADIYVREIRKIGVPLYSFPDSLSAFSKVLAFRRLVKRLKPEVVHSYSFYTNFPVRWGTLGSRAIAVGSIRQDFITERKLDGEILGRMNSRWPTTQICNSLAAERAVQHSRYFFRPIHVRTVRNALNISRFEFHPLPQNGAPLLAVGRLFPEKRWDRLLNCIATLASRGLKFSVCHAGDGPLLKELKAQSSNLGLDGLVQFLGRRYDVRSLLRDSTFLIHTADAEGCPNVVMEAMACGRAVVATDAGDVPFLVEDGKTGFVVRRGDDATLVERIATLITNRGLCRRMGETGRAKAEREFDLGALVSKTLDAYRSAGWKDL